MYKYEFIICWSNVDGTFVAEVPERPGCMAHGETQEVALQNINEAMALWIDTASEFGDPIPEPKGERLMLARGGGRGKGGRGGRAIASKFQLSAPVERHYAF